MENNRILSEIIVQFLGFGVVFFVLKKLAWSKLLGAIDARRQKIEDDFASLRKQKDQLAALEAEYRGRLDTIEQEARRKIHEAAEQGAVVAREVQDKAREDADKLVERARAEIAHDLQQARLKIRDEIVEVSGLLTEKVIGERLDTAAHAKLIDRFLKDLERV